MKTLRVLPHIVTDLLTHQQADGMRELYTCRVFPDTLLQLWNHGLGSMSHVVAHDEEPDSVRAQLIDGFVHFIVKTLLPVITRLLTYREAMDGVFAMHALNLPSHIFKLQSSQPRQKNQKRLTNVLQFFGHPEAAQELRRTSLALQSTGTVTNLSAPMEKG